MHRSVERAEKKASGPPHASAVAPLDCADYQAKLLAKARHASALAEAVQRYEGGASHQLETIARHVQALRELDAESVELLFAADAAVTAMLLEMTGLAGDAAKS